MKGTIKVTERLGEILAAIVLVLLSSWISRLALRMPLGTGAEFGHGAVPAALGLLLIMRLQPQRRTRCCRLAPCLHKNCLQLP